MKRFVLTGAPGAGKTAILRQLELNEFEIVSVDPGPLVDRVAAVKAIVYAASVE